MGVKRHNGEASDPLPGQQELASGSIAGGPSFTSRGLEKSSSRRRGMEKSILDDIMGDPEDFRDFPDSEAGSESDGGRWEDAVRAALENEDAAAGAHHEETRGTETGRKSSGGRVLKKCDTSADPEKDRSHAPSSSSGDRGVAQNGRNRQRERESHGPSSNGTPKRHKVFDTRYFIIKSLNHHNIAKSIEKGIWATQAMNEPVLNEAFETTEQVILVFSVNMSGHFQGYAQMTTPIGRRRANVWTEANDGANPWGGSFGVEWHRLYDLPFQKTVHLKNPLNHMKPVKISRDCQELTPEVGEALCALIDDGADREGRPKRKVGTAEGNTQGSKRTRGELAGPPPDAPLRPRPHAAGHMPMMYGGPMFHPGVPHDPYAFPGAMTMNGRSSRPLNLEQPRTSKSRSPHHGTTEKPLERDRDRNKDLDKDRHKEKPRVVEREVDRERSRNGSGSQSVVPEDDLLDMTYEEYLQRHGHARDFGGYPQGNSRFQCHPPGGAYGRGWMGRGYADDQYANYIANWYGRQGPMMSGDVFYGMGAAYPGLRPPDPYRHSKPDDMPPPPPRRVPRGSEGKSSSNGGSSEKSGRAPQQQH